MKCPQAKSQFSPFYDGVLPQSERRALESHLEGCPECAAEWSSFRRLQSQLSSLGPAPMPANLALRLRVTLSKEIARSRRPRFELALDRLEHLWHTYAVPAVSGALTAVTVFVLLLSVFAPAPVAASSADVPLLLSTPPELEASSLGAGSEAGTIMENSLLVEVLLDEQGQVFDYRIISATGEGSRLLPQVKNMLLFTRFQPAMNMGRPITGRALLAFSALGSARRQA